LTKGGERTSAHALENPGEVARGKKRSSRGLAEEIGLHGRLRLHSNPGSGKSLRVLDRIELPVESRRGDFQRVAMGDLVGGVEQGRDLPRDSLALLEVDRLPVLTLEHHAQDG